MLGISIICILTVSYVGLILTYVVGWHCVQKWASTKPLDALQTSICVIIPARNEAANIDNCLAAIVHQQFPKNLLEIIVIDDYSTDETPLIVQKWVNRYPYISLIKLVEHLSASEQKKLNAYKKGNCTCH